MVNQFIKNSTAVLYRRQTTIISAATIMMVLVLASRILGFVRNWFLAHYFPVAQLDSYKAAFVLPDILANVLITGALSVAFIPVFTTYLNRNNEKEGWRMASDILNISLLFYAIVTVFLIIFARPILEHFVVPGFDDEKLTLTANVTTIVLLGEFLLIIGSFFTSVLQSFHRFIVPALAPILYNLGIIVGIIWFRPFGGLMGVAWGVVLGGFLHILIQVPLARTLGFRYKFEFNFRDPGVLKTIKLSLPRAAGIAFAQMEWWISIFLSSLLVSQGFVGSVAVLGFAADIQNLPVGLFGITFATAALPTLSSEWAARKTDDFKATFIATLHQILYLTVPLGILFMVLRIPLVRLMLGSGQFDWDSTVATAVTMSYFAIGIFAQAAFFLLIRAFYALHDAATPLKVALASLAFHGVISAFFIFRLAQFTTIPVAFLGLASALTNIFCSLILLYLLDRKLGGFDRKKLLLPIGKIMLAAGVMGIFLYGPLHLKFGGTYLIDYIIDTTHAFNLLVLTLGAASFGLAVYILVTWWLGSDELRTFARLFPDMKKLQKFLVFDEKVPDPTQNP